MDISRNYQIMNGPSADRLFDALKYAYDKKGANVTIDFDVSEGLTSHNKEVAAYLKMDAKNWHISSITHEDGSGHSFNLAGYVAIKTSTEYENYSFSAYYNANSRTGSISFKKH